MGENPPPTPSAAVPTTAKMTAALRNRTCTASDRAVAERLQLSPSHQKALRYDQSESRASSTGRCGELSGGVTIGAAAAAPVGSS